MPEKLWAGFPRKATSGGLDAIVSTDVRNNSVDKGELFQFFHKFDVLAGATYNIVFTTPSDRDVRDMPSVISTSVDKVTFQFFEGATFTGGTAITGYNQNRQSVVLPLLSIKGNATITTTGNQVAQVWMAGAESIGQTRSGSQGGGGETHWKLKRNTTYLLRFINGSSATNTIQLNEIWLEEV